MTRARLLLVVAALVATTGCSAAASTPAPAAERVRPVLATSPPPEIDTRDLRTVLLSTMPDCGAAPPASTAEPVPGLLLPEGSVVTGVRPSSPPLVEVRAYVPADPVTLLEFFAAEGTLLVQEDEVLESEALVGTGTHRQFAKATAVCAAGSEVVVVVAPEQSAAGLPVPSSAPLVPDP